MAKEFAKSQIAELGKHYHEKFQTLQQKIVDLKHIQIDNESTILKLKQSLVESNSKLEEFELKKQVHVPVAEIQRVDMDVSM